MAKKWKQAKEDPLLTATDVAEMFSVDPRTIRRWIDEGLIRSVPLPSGVKRVRMSEVQKYLSSDAVGQGDGEKKEKV